MSKYGAYIAGMPCKNKSCKSYGVPHPNCKCYPGMAEGGEAGFYCDDDRFHLPDCQYFQSGGEVVPDDEVIPDDEVVIDSIPTAPPTPSPESPRGIIPDDEVTIDAVVIPSDDVTPDADPEGVGQQVLAHAEAAGRGLIGPGMPLIEAGLSKVGVPGLSLEEQEARKVANPSTQATEALTLMGSMFLPVVGQYNVAAGAMKVGAKAAELAHLGTLGSATIKGAIQTGLLQGSDEITKYLLGEQNADPTAALSAIIGNTAAAGLFGIGGEYAGAMIGKGLEKMKIGSKLQDFMIGLGSASIDADPEIRKYALSQYKQFLSSPQAYAAGQKFFDNVLRKMGAAGAASFGIGGAAKGYYESGVAGGLVGGAEGLVTGFLLGALGNYGSKAFLKYTYPMVMKMVSSGNMDNVVQLLDHAREMARGAKKINDGVDNLFKAGPQQAFDFAQEYKTKEKLAKKIEEDGGMVDEIQREIYQQNKMPEAPPEPVPGFAEGGEVQKNQTSMIQKPMAEHYPELNTLQQTAKARVATYLNGIRPLKSNPKLAFDSEPPDTQKKKSYSNALSVAVNPLGVLERVKRGTIEPEHVKHLNAMYPEFHDYLNKRLTERITKAQMKGEKPPLAVRQGLSLLMGVPLSGDMTPKNIQAAQATFQMTGPQQSQVQAKKPKRKTAGLSNFSHAYLTSNAASTSRKQLVK